MERSACWGSSTHRGLLVFTSALLLCEIVVSRLCNSLINTVDSFHTLYILIHLILHPLEMLTGASVTSIASPYTSPDHDGPVVQHPSSAIEDPTGTNPLPSSSAVQPDHVVSGTATAPAVSGEDQYSVSRIQPFGAAVSALLLGSLCVSITLEIITHTLQPHVIKHPLLATVVGVASLLFNILILIWRGGRETNLGVDGLSKDLAQTQNETFATSNDQAEVKSLDEGSSNPEVEETGHSSHCTLEASLHGGVLMFCNPGAPSVLDPDQTRECCSSTLANSNNCTDYQQTQQTHHMTEHLRRKAANYNVCLGHAGAYDHVNRRSKRQEGGSVRSISAAICSLLGSILVIANGLALLLFGLDCLQPRWACYLLPYLDPVFSMATVMILIATALPELQHHALMLLQAAPAHLCLEELNASIGRVPGVLAIHELHVWQLSEEHLVASVHVHCPSGLGALQCSELLVTITDVLKRFGVSHCTVQPEFITSHGNDPQPSGTNASAMSAGAAAQPLCSLRCGKECARKMCCSPPEEHPCTGAPTTGDMEMGHQDIVIENTYL